VLTIVAISNAGPGLKAEATILVEPKNVAVPCPPGTRFIFKNLVIGNQIFFDTWTITAISKSGKTVTSGSFTSVSDDRLGEAGEIVFDLMEELCEELSQPGSSGFLARKLITVGLQPSDVALGEFNGDGRPDLAVANQGSNTVSIALGTAGGGFGPTVNFPTGTKPVRIAAGDVNNDGKQDLVTANLGTGTAGDLSLLLGNGDGTFQLPVPIAAGSLPVDLVLGDWNGDGKLDLAVADSSGNAVVVRLGNGNGSFQPPVSLPTGTFSSASIVAVDLNGDGKLDLVTNGAIFLGNGDGSFQPAVNFAAGSQPSLVRTGDLNRDGKPDLVTASNGSNIVSAHLGNGDGTVQAARHYVVGSFPNEVAIFDVDGNGTPDLVVSNANDDHISVLHGRGEGTFLGASAYLVGGASSVAVADFTGDGVPDLLTPAVSLLPGLGLGRFGTAVPVAGLIGSHIVAGDWNGDGKMDLALVANTLRVALGNGDGTFAAPVDLPLPAGGNSLAPVVADWNGDGKPDLLVPNTGDFDALNGSLSVFLNTGAGTFTAQPVIPLGNQPFGTPSVAAGDVNGDGKVDLVVANQGKFNQTNGDISVMLGNGNGTFGPPQILRASIEPDSVALGDLNGDGHLDIVAVVQAPVFDWNLNVFFGTGAGGFGNAVVIALPQDLISGLRLADLDLDGRPDIIVSFEGTKLGLLKNRGDGSFEPPVLVDAGAGFAVPADLNRDGRPDLVVATHVGLNVLLNATLVPGAPGTVASILPVSRAVPVSAPATVFATILNPSGTPFTNCDITPIPMLPATFLFQTTEQGTNVPTGTPNTRVGIPDGGSQTFVLAFTPHAAFPPPRRRLRLRLRRRHPC